MQATQPRAPEFSPASPTVASNEFAQLAERIMKQFAQLAERIMEQFAQLAERITQAAAPGLASGHPRQVRHTGEGRGGHRSTTGTSVAMTSVQKADLGALNPIDNDAFTRRFGVGPRAAGMLPDEFGAGAPDRVARYRDHPDVVSEVVSDAATQYALPDPPFADPDDDADE